MRRQLTVAGAAPKGIARRGARWQARPVDHVASLVARIAVLGALVAGVLAVAACRRTIPTERRMVVAQAVAPGLAEPLPDAPASRTVTWGEVYTERARKPDLTWKGPFEGRREERTGGFEATRRPFDAPRFAFTSDFIEADVPTAGWLCAKMDMARATRALCEEQLIRVVASGDTLLAYVPTWQPDSPIAELREGQVRSSALPGLSELQVVTLDERTVVLAKTHWIRSREWTGSSLVVLLLSPPLTRAGEIPLTETDARDAAKVVYTLRSLRVAGDGLYVGGRRSVRSGASNEELEGTNIEERWGLGADGKLERREAKSP
jgi:hypothetical protein